MDAQKNIKKQCVVCESEGNQDNPLMSLFGPNEFICMVCYAEQNQKLVQYKNNRPMIFPDYDQIVKGLFLGNEDAAIDEESIAKNQIRAICVCGSYLMTPFEGKVMEGKFTNIQYKKHFIADFPSQLILDKFDDNNKWIESMMKEGRNILVHCAAGVSRSSSFVIAYLMKTRGWTFKEAFTFVKERRKIASPNSGFVQQLKQYEKQLNPKA